MTHISSGGRLSVNEGAVNSPYFQYPMNPKEIKIAVTKTMPMFKTPNDLSN